MSKSPHDPILSDVRDLVALYATNRDAYLAADSDFNETETRTNFIDPLFYALHWDMSNKLGVRADAQEVRRERGPTKGEPDYTFHVRHGGEKMSPVFFVEAKKPRERIDTPKHLFQARSYAFSAAPSSLVLVVLTNFERTLIYRVDSEPKLDDPNDYGLVLSWSYKDYVEKFESLMILERNRVRAGSLSSLSRHDVPIKNRPAVEGPFLARLGKIREILANDLYQSSPDLSEHDINIKTETVVNRLVFIRFAEDREILPQKDLLAVTKQWNNKRRGPFVAALEDYFLSLNAMFNGRLFDDKVVSHAAFTDEALQQVIRDLYAPQCPYRFDKIRVSILGDIYEKHLGSMIVRKPGGVFIEEKPEVRNAGGVYYTPEYIVDHMVNSCVNRVLSTYQTVEEVLTCSGIDMACGSGSFLIRCFHAYLDKILEISSHGNVPGPYLAINLDGTLRVNFETKRRVLQECIFGIDIDSRAVKVAELSLYLSLLEDEPDLNPDSIPYLPHLSHSLRCGNSLIDDSMMADSDYEPALATILERIRPLQWDVPSREDARIKSEKGFDWIVGNPPYIRVQTLRKYSPREVDIINEKYKLASGSWDIYIAFIERSLSKLSQKGTVCLIVSNKFLAAKYGKLVRERLTSSASILQVVDFGDKQVFEDATTYTCIITANNSPYNGSTLVRLVGVEPSPSVLTTNIIPGVTDIKIDLQKSSSTGWRWDGMDSEPIATGFTRLGLVAQIFQGLRTSANHVFVLHKCSVKNGMVFGWSEYLEEQVSVELEICRPFIESNEISRDVEPEASKFLVFPYVSHVDATLLNWHELEKSFPKAAHYLSRCKKSNFEEGATTPRKKVALLSREAGKIKTTEWFGYIYPKNFSAMTAPKIIIREVAERCTTFFDNKGIYFFVSMYGILIRDQFNPTSDHYLFMQAVLQTQMVNERIIGGCTRMANGYYPYRKQFLENIAFPVYNSEKKEHERLVVLQASAIKFSTNAQKMAGSAKEALARKLQTIEAEIETIVQDLYSSSTTGESQQTEMFRLK